MPDLKLVSYRCPEPGCRELTMPALGMVANEKETLAHHVAVLWCAVHNKEMAVMAIEDAPEPRIVPASAVPLQVVDRNGGRT